MVTAGMRANPLPAPAAVVVVRLPSDILLLPVRLHR
jgi:hypothetical protein